MLFYQIWYELGIKCYFGTYSNTQGVPYKLNTLTVLPEKLVVVTKNWHQCKFNELRDFRFRYLIDSSFVPYLKLKYLRNSSSKIVSSIFRIH